MNSLGIIRMTNARLWSAVVGVRLDRNPASMAEFYDARNARRTARMIRLTPQERARINAAWLLTPAGH